MVAEAVRNHGLWLCAPGFVGIVMQEAVRPSINTKAMIPYSLYSYAVVLYTLHRPPSDLGNCVGISKHVWQRLKNIGLVTGPGGLFATRLVTELGGLATNPPCEKSIEDYNTLHRGPRQRFYFESQPQAHICTYTHISIHINVRTYIYIYCSSPHKGLRAPMHFSTLTT